MRISFSVLTALIAVGCNSVPTSLPKVKSLAVPFEVAATEAGDTIHFGGYGSSMAYDAKDSIFYLLTDRGPNVDGLTKESKMFPFPSFSPTIGKFRWVGDSLVLLEKITLKESDGIPILGLPNRVGDGVTGEVAYNLSGDIITGDYRGVDSEGLALAPDGTFYVSDEYAPFVLHFDQQGMLLGEMSPSNGLPSYYALRRPNRGMEGITISNDGKHLYGIMQSPLYYPDSSTKDVSVNNRIIEIDIESGVTREFIYELSDPLNVVSEISTLSDGTMLVVERDEEFPSGGEGFKRIYRIDISNATDVSGQAIELLNSAELRELFINPAAKELYIDILKSISDYCHDKVEGIAVVDEHNVAIVNDDDFSASETADGGFEAKINGSGDVDHAVVYIIPIDSKR